MLGKWPQRSWSTAVPGHVYWAGLVAHKGSETLTIPYSGTRLREDSKQQNVQNGAPCSCEKARSSSLNTEGSPRCIVKEKKNPSI